MNSIKLYLLIFVLFKSCTTGNQELNSYHAYHQQNLRVEHLISEGQIQESLDLFEEMIKAVDYVPSTHYFSMARAASRISDCHLAALYFTKAISLVHDKK